MQPAGKKVPIPFIRAITVPHGKDSTVELDPVAVAHTFGLDELMHIRVLVPLSQGEGSTAEEILESLVLALDYFGDC